MLLQVLDGCYESLRLALRFCLQDVSKDMFSKGLISESTMTSPNYDTVISEFKTGMKEKEDTPQLEKHCQLFLTCLSSQGGPAEAVAEDLAEQWKEEVQKELNISLSLDVVISDQDMEQMESELVEANTEMTEHITTNETGHLESLDIRDHFHELLRQFKNELHGKIAKREEELSNITNFVQQFVSTEDLCDAKDLDEVVKKLDCYYNFLDCQIIVLFAKRFASPSLLQKFESHSKEAKTFCRSHTIKILQNCFDANLDSRQINASISLHIAWGNVIINGLYMLIEQFSVRHGSHLVLKHIKVTESSVHIEYFMRNSSMEIQEIIAHAEEKIAFMCSIGIYEFAINGHTILQVDNEENFTFGLALLNAARTGHNEAVQFLLDLTDNTDPCTEKGTTALMLASEVGYEPVVKSLLLAGANVNSQNKDGWTALMISSRNNHITIVHTLLEAGADPHLQISDGHNALMIASFSGHSEVVELLLNVQADVDIQNNYGRTALMIACIKGHIKVVELLLDRKANSNIQDNEGYTALMLGSRDGYSQIVESLLKDSDPNIQNTDGHTALRFANQNSHFQTVELLLNHHANPNIQDMHELHWAVLGSMKRNSKFRFLLTQMSGTAEDYIKIVQLLIGHSSIDIDAVTDTGVTSLMCASMFGCTEVVKLLLEAGANLNIQVKTSITMKDVMSNLPDDTLLQPQAKPFFLPQYNNDLVKGMTINGWTALMLASSEGHLDIVQILLQAKAIPDLQNKNGDTVLLIAAAKGHSDIVQQLLECGANPNICNRNGSTPLYAAVYCLSLRKFENDPIMSMGCKIVDPVGSYEDHLKIIQLLIAQPNVNIIVNTSVNGYTSLHIASMHGSTDAVKLLLQVSADPNIQTHSVNISNTYLSHVPSNILLQPQLKTLFLINDFQTMSGGTALMIASTNGHSEIVQLLLNAKAKPDLQTENGETALCLAAFRGYPDIVQLLLEYGADPNISNRHGVTAIHAAATGLCTVTAIARGNITSMEVVNTITTLISGKYERYVKTMKLLIAQPNIKINETNLTGVTILMQASIVGSAQIVELLLQAGADPNMSMKTPIDKSISTISEILFGKEIHFVVNEAIGCTALILACEYGHLEVVQLLLKANANPNHEHEGTGITALIIAVQEGFSDIVQQLLEYGADPNIRDKNGCTAIHYIMILDDTETPKSSKKTMSDKLEILQLLIVRGINVNIMDETGRTALMMASIDGFTEVVKLLLQAGADPNIEQHIPVKELFITSNLPETHTIGLTALMCASLQMNSEVTDLLLQANANPNQENALALMIAAEQGYPDIVQQLLEYGADPNSISDINGFTALHNVLDSRTKTAIKLTLIQQLIEKGANIINIQNEDGLTALMMATDDGLLEIVELLLQNGADPNIRGKKGWTALMYACNHGNSKVAKSLLRYSANPQLVDNNGFTASIHALRSGNKVLAYELVNGRDFSQSELKCLLIMDLLEGEQTEAISRLDDITDLTTDKKELLISCVVGSLEDVISKLHESDLHPDTPLVGGLTLLMIASSCGYIELVQYLILLEADVNQRDTFWKYTPLFYAVLGSKSSEIVELLLENGADINAVVGNQTPLDLANSSPVKSPISSLLVRNGGKTFSRLTSDIQPPITIFADLSNQVKSLIQDTVVKREHTECTHT